MKTCLRCLQTVPALTNGRLRYHLNPAGAFCRGTYTRPLS